jgi:hypothetical protein
MFQKPMVMLFPLSDDVFRWPLQETDTRHKNNTEQNEAKERMYLAKLTMLQDAPELSCFKLYVINGV